MCTEAREGLSGRGFGSIRNAGQVLLISLETAEPAGAVLVRHAFLQGRRVLGVLTTSADGLPSLSRAEARLALISDSALCERIEVEACSRSRIHAAVHRCLAERAVFPGSFRHVLQVDTFVGGHAVAWVTAAAEAEVEAALHQVGARHRPVEVVSTGQAAVAALTRAVCTRTHLVHWLRRGRLTSLVVDRGHVSWSRVQRVPTDGGEAAQWESTIRAAEGAIPSRLHARLQARMFLGTDPDRAVCANPFGLERIDPRSRFARLFSGVEPEEVMGSPELFGLAFLSPAQSLASDDYRRRVRIWRLGRRLVVAMLGAVVVALSGAVAAWRYAHSFEARTPIRDRADGEPNVM